MSIGGYLKKNKNRSRHKIKIPLTNQRYCGFYTRKRKKKIEKQGKWSHLPWIVKRTHFVCIQGDMISLLVLVIWSICFNSQARNQEQNYQNSSLHLPHHQDETFFPTNKKRVWVYLVICNRPRFCPSKTGFPSKMGNEFGDLRYEREKTKIFTSSQHKENLFILFYLQSSIGSCLNIVSKVRDLTDAEGMRLQICKR